MPNSLRIQNLPKFNKTGKNKNNNKQVKKVGRSKEIPDRANTSSQSHISWKTHKISITAFPVCGPPKPLLSPSSSLVHNS
ncbi:hypothetical protein L484_022677 [Morus notabilis]|uniref:Uncharacterized protein n=1 Tax=Morus notabilis TaxID=981085 RepID=W9QXM4_9ROSA|nr:hypothetical protein L484_022677 [Morus notabilis]